MIKPLIKLRKWLWLPIKYKLLRKKYIKETKMRPKSEIWDLRESAIQLKILSEKGLDQQQTHKYEVQIELLNWILCDKAE